MITTVTVCGHCDSHVDNKEDERIQIVEESSEPQIQSMRKGKLSLSSYRLKEFA